MDSKWANREYIEQEIQGVDSDQVEYDYEQYRYSYLGSPFTGVSIERYADGTLRSVVHFVEGFADGLAVLWYPNGQIRAYREMEADSYHGIRIEWDENGTKCLESRYLRGRRIDNG